MIQGLKAARVPLALTGLAGGLVALAIWAHNRPEPVTEPGISTWKGHEGSLKNVTYVNGTRDARNGAWKLQTRGSYPSDLTVAGSATSDGFRAGVFAGRNPGPQPFHNITATADASGALSGQVTTTAREINDRGDRFDTTLTKARFEAKGKDDGSWSGLVKLADVGDDEEVKISGSNTGDKWTVAIDRPNSPYIPHTEYKGTGPITMQEQIALAVTDAT